MLFGIAGAHRTGKSTLARAVAEDLGIHYEPSSITRDGRSLGFDTVAPMTLDERVSLQAGLLERHVAMLQATVRPMIVDRTPLDMIGYLAAEFDMNAWSKVSAETQDRAEAIKNECLEVTVKYYDFIFIATPLPVYVEEPGRPAPSRIFQSHIQLIVEGAAQQIFGRTPYARMNSADFEQRREFVHDGITTRLDAIDRLKRSASYVH